MRDSSSYRSLSEAEPRQHPHVPHLSFATLIPLYHSPLANLLGDRGANNDAARPDLFMCGPMDSRLDFGTSTTRLNSGIFI